MIYILEICSGYQQHINFNQWILILLFFLKSLYQPQQTLNIIYNSNVKGNQNGYETLSWLGKYSQSHAIITYMCLTTILIRMDIQCGWLMEIEADYFNLFLSLESFHFYELPSLHLITILINAVLVGRCIFVWCARCMIEELRRKLLIILSSYFRSRRDEKRYCNAVYVKFTWIFIIVYDWTVQISVQQKSNKTIRWWIFLLNILMVFSILYSQ